MFVRAARVHLLMVPTSMPVVGVSGRSQSWGDTYEP